jgi:hypothetical protein
MTRWLGWSVLAAALIAGGYLAALNPGPVELAIGPDRAIRLPLGVIVTGAMGAGAVAVGLAALLAGKLDVKGQVVVSVLSGANIDADMFAKLVAA